MFFDFFDKTENYEYLKGMLSELTPDERSITIQDWDTNGQVYLDFINIEQVRTSGN